MTWTDASTPLDPGSCYGGCWSDDLAQFVGVGLDDGDSGAVVTSPDGVTWTAQASPFDGAGGGRDVVWNSFLGLYVAVGGDIAGDAIMTSPDGVTWTGLGCPWTGAAGTVGSRVACKPSNGAVVVGGANRDTGLTADALATSPDAVTFTPVASVFDNDGSVTGLAYSPSQDLWLAVGVKAGTGNVLAAYSTDDGATWTTLGDTLMTGTTAPVGLYRDETAGRWWLLGQTVNGFSAVYSDDAVGLNTWAEVSTPLDPVGGDGAAYAMAEADGGTLVLVGRDATDAKQMCVSTDGGDTWAFDVDPSPFSDGYGRAVAYSAPLVLAVAFGAEDGLLP